jgi:NADH-quinone oxidoreductase subunit J
LVKILKREPIVTLNKVKIVFYLISIWIMVSGVAAISMKNLVHCAVALIAFFAGIAGIFFMLHAEFLGAVQMIVYVGAVAVLILFAIMLTRNVTGTEVTSPFSAGALGGWFCSLVILGILVCYALPGYAPVLASTLNETSVKDIGTGFMTKYAIPFEVISLLLTAALIGSVIIALEEPKGKK